jgi:alkylated DNA repair protein (DNA oxidative demethylase)
MGTVDSGAPATAERGGAARHAMLPLFPRMRQETAPGAVHIPSWLDLEQQRALVEACRTWAVGPAPMRHTRLASGGVMSVQTVCLGWHWLPYRYSRTADGVDGAPVKPFPDWLGDLGRRAVLDAYGDSEMAPCYAPDAPW